MGRLEVATLILIAVHILYLVEMISILPSSLSGRLKAGIKRLQLARGAGWPHLGDTSLR
jgi:hypothetical protein